MTILITRPQTEANKLAKILMNCSIKTIVEPLLIIKPIKPHFGFLDYYLLNAQAVLITSINALRAIANFSLIRNITIIAVGNSCYIKAKLLGYPTVIAASGDVLSLIELVKVKFSSQTGWFFYPSADIIEIDLVEKLIKYGFITKRLIIYKSLAVDSFSSKLLSLFKNQQLRGVVFFSKRTVKIFKNLIKYYQLSSAVRSLIVFNLSQKIADEADELRCLASYTANEATEASLFNLIKNKLT